MFVCFFVCLFVFNNKLQANLGELWHKKKHYLAWIVTDDGIVLDFLFWGQSELRVLANIAFYFMV